jgi:hypothetical protein
MTRIALVGLIAILVAVNLVCVFVDKTPYVQDSGRYLILSHCYFEAWAGRQNFLHCHLDRTDQKPDIWLAVGAAMQQIFFRLERQDVVIVAEQIFFAILLVAVYAAARRLAPEGPPATALLAAFVTGVSPVVFGMSKKYMGDLPLAAMVWTAFALLPADFRRLRRAAAFGVACGLGLLMRPTFALFLVGPALLAFAASCRAKNDRGRALLGAGVAGLAAAVLAAPWYLVNFRHSYRQYFEFGENLPRSWRDFGGLSGSYLRLIGAEQMGWVFAALAALGLARLLAVKELRARFGPRLAAGFAAAAVPFFYLASARVAFARYAIGWVPFLALLAAFGLLADAAPAAPRSIARRRSAAWLAVGWGLFQFGFMSFTTRPWTARPPLLERVMGFPGYQHFPGDTHVGLFRLNRVGWGDREFCRAIDELRPGQIRVLLLTDRPCGEAIAFQAVKWCIVFDESRTQEIRTDLAGDRLAAAAAAAQRWPHLVLLHYADEARLAEAVAAFGLETPGRYQRVLRQPAADGFVALYRNSAPEAGAPPPPTIAAPGECVDYGKCREWCVKMVDTAEKR